MKDAELPGRKTILRATMRERLAALAPAERADRSRRIVQRIAELPAWAGATGILMFAPLATEPDLDLLWASGALAGKRVAYPRAGETTLRLFYVDGLDELEPTRWGLREPPAQPAREATLGDFAVVLVPGLVFDTAGGRLGRGGGYYDRLLATRPAGTQLIGVGFAFQHVAQALPRAAHDVFLDAICTDADVPCT